VALGRSQRPNWLHSRGLGSRTSPNQSVQRSPHEQQGYQPLCCMIAGMPEPHTEQIIGAWFLWFRKRGTLQHSCPTRLISALSRFVASVLVILNCATLWKLLRVASASACIGFVTRSFPYVLVTSFSGKQFFLGRQLVLMTTSFALTCPSICINYHWDADVWLYENKICKWPWGDDEKKQT